MKKTLAIAFASALFCNAQAQQAVGTPENLQRFKNTTTMVVLDNNPLLEYNFKIKETVEKHWNINKYDVVTFSSADFEKARKDSTKAFLMRNTVYNDRDKTKSKFDYLCVELGGDYEYIRQMPDIASVPICYNGVDEASYGYKLGLLCQFLQNHIKLTTENPKLTSKNILKYYNSQMADIHDKTLYLVKDELNPDLNTEAKIKSLYPYKFKIVSREEVEAAIDRHDPDVVLLHKVGPEGTRKKEVRCYKVIVGAADARLYYFAYHMISDKNKEGMLAKDFQKLAKAKKK
ncbi:MAG: hypothetical protein IKP62_09205 [Salinivirgaceae bacterium]|nr:hypothetical protein [Salinivirgaceae bacterium]